MSQEGDGGSREGPVRGIKQDSFPEPSKTLPIAGWW